MPIALTCTCGAKLEIDDAFAGKTIPCPDCAKPLVATTASPEQRTSVLALTSLFLALAGGFTLIGGLVAAGLGFLAKARIQRAPDKLAGEGLAQAGIILGFGFSVLTAILLFISPFGIDGPLRAMQWAGRLDYSAGDRAKQKTEQAELAMYKPAGFGEVRSPDPLSQDGILLYNVTEDAYITCFTSPPQEEKLQAALKLLSESDVLRMILLRRVPDKASRSNPALQKLLPTFPDPGDDVVGKTISNVGWDSWEVDIVLAGRTRTVLVYWAQPAESPLIVAAAVARKERYAGLKSELEKSLQSVEWK